MIKIGIELNGVIRDINTQYLKYFMKDIKPDFDDSVLNMNVTSILDNLPFDSNASKNKFVFEDYPYELFGCAAPTSRNLHTYLNGWAYDLFWYKGFDDICVFSLGEDELTIQSTFFYLSKSGTRIRNTYFPRHASDVWDRFDVVITTSEDIINSKPNGKVSILINKDDNKFVKEKATLNYDSLIDLLHDNDFPNKVMQNMGNDKNIFVRIKNKIKSLIKKNTKNE